MDTIYAVATAAGRSGVAVIRVSGPDVQSVCTKFGIEQLPERRAVLRQLLNHEGEVIDTGLVLFFRAPHSFTGENIVEFHTHGSPAVVKAFLTELARSPGCRLAEPGEFTRRALTNGKLDLVQVEGLGDLLNAETELQREQAYSAMSGTASEFCEVLRTKLVRAAALLEASIDFADEDVPQDVSCEVVALLEEVNASILDALLGRTYAERIRTGFTVALVGRPNSGKSTLLNKIAGRDVAIASEFAGTTRDVIEVHLDLDGLPVTFLDTAGLRETTDSIEAIGISRSMERANAADLRVYLTSPGEAAALDLKDEDLVKLSKCDLRDNPGNGVSGHTGEGVDTLLAEVRHILSKRIRKPGIASRERHFEALERAQNHLCSALALVESGPDRYDVAAEELRVSTHQLEVLIGRVSVDSLLDEVFSSFCLGK